MTTRRGFLGGLLAATVVPCPTWADVGNPRYLAAAKLPNGDYQLVGLNQLGEAVFGIPLPGRGHAAAAHPTRPEAVAFARRPGTFAVVIDCLSGNVTNQLDAPPGRHFYGHGTYSTDGSTMFTTENDYGAGVGRIGVWDVGNGYNRIGEFDSGGVGPHDILRLPGSDIMVVANGGIDTHPDTGRAKLNLPTMAPNLTYVDRFGAILEQVALASEMHMNSIRHLTVRKDHLIAFAMQTQGDLNQAFPLLGLHRMGDNARLIQAPTEQHRGMHGYGTSIAFSHTGSLVSISSSKGGRVQVFEVESGNYDGSYFADDVSGISAGPEGFVVSSGTGEIVSLRGAVPTRKSLHNLSWDNHLISVGNVNP